MSVSPFLQSIHEFVEDKKLLDKSGRYRWCERRSRLYCVTSCLEEFGIFVYSLSL